MRHKRLTDSLVSASPRAAAKEKSKAERERSSPYLSEKKKRRESEEIFRL